MNWLAWFNCNAELALVHNKNPHRRLLEWRQFFAVFKKLVPVSGLSTTLLLSPVQQTPVDA